MNHSKKIKGHIEELVCELHAQGLTPSAISRKLKQQDFSITQPSIWRYINNSENTPKLQRAIQKYRSDPLAVDNAHKRIRLEDLNRERLSLIATLQTFKDSEGKVLSKKFYRYLNGLKKLIDLEIAARDEVEKRPDMVALFQRIGPLSEYTNEDLIREKRVIESQLLIVKRGGTSIKEAPSDNGGTKGKEEK